jgi:hypothetical protein
MESLIFQLTFLNSHLSFKATPAVCSCRLPPGSSPLKLGFAYKLVVEFPIKLAQNLGFA